MLLSHIWTGDISGLLPLRPPFREDGSSCAQVTLKFYICIKFLTSKKSRHRILCFSGGYVLDGGALCMELMTPQVELNRKEQSAHIQLFVQFAISFSLHVHLVSLVIGTQYSSQVIFDKKTNFSLQGLELCLHYWSSDNAGLNSAFWFWSTLKTILFQISATLVKGKARIKFDAPKVWWQWKKETFKLDTGNALYREHTAWQEHSSPSSPWSTSMRKMVSPTWSNWSFDVYASVPGWFTPPQSDG